MEQLARLGLVLERPGKPGLQAPERQRPESVLRVLGQPVRPVRPAPQGLERLEQRRPESVQPEPLVQLQGLVPLEQP